MTDKQVKAYSTKCEIEYSQEYLKRRDITVIFEDTFVVRGPGKIMARERICGFYHGKPDEQSLENYLAKGCEAIMEDEWLGALTKTHECVSKNEEPEEPIYDYAVVIYGGFDEIPLIRYQRNYDDLSQALERYHKLADTFRFEHKIFDNNTEEFIAQEECSSMAIIKCGPYDDAKVICFKSLLYYEEGKTNASYFNEDYRQIVNYLVENFNL